MATAEQPKLIVVHDAQGVILALGRAQEVGDKPSGLSGVWAVPGPGQQISFADLPAGHEKTPLHELLTTLRLNLRTGALVHGTNLLPIEKKGGE